MLVELQSNKLLPSFAIFAPDPSICLTLPFSAVRGLEQRWFVQINAILTKLPKSSITTSLNWRTSISKEVGILNLSFTPFYKTRMILLGGAGTVKTLCLTLLCEIKRFLKPALLMLHTADSWFDIYPSLFNLWMKWSLNLKITFESNISGLFPPHRGSVELGHSLCFDVEINFNTHIA